MQDQALGNKPTDETNVAAQFLLHQLAICTKEDIHESRHSIKVVGFFPDMYHLLLCMSDGNVQLQCIPW